MFSGLFSGRGKLLRIVLLFVALVVIGVIQWESQKARRDQPLYGTVLVRVVPHATETTSCTDWSIDVYLENSTGNPIKLNGFTVHTSFDGVDEETANRGTLSTKSDNPIWELSKGKQTRMWHIDDGCAKWAGHGSWEQGPAMVQYHVTVYTSDGIFSSMAKTAVSIPSHGGSS